MGGTPYLPLDTINIWWFLTYFVPYNMLGNLGPMSYYIKAHLDILWFVRVFNESNECIDEDWLCIYGNVQQGTYVPQEVRQQALS